jgi:hypothetical protein
MTITVAGAMPGTNRIDAFGYTMTGEKRATVQQ